MDGGSRSWDGEAEQEAMGTEAWPAPVKTVEPVMMKWW